MNARGEITRIRYLQAMGMTVYVSHRRLPGAAPTRKLMLAADALPAVAATAGEESQAVAVGAPGAVPEHLRDSLRSTTRGVDARWDSYPGEGAVRRAAVAPVVDGSAGPAHLAARGEVQCFSLAVVVCARRLWVEDLADEALATDQVQLIGAIGRALSHPAKLPAEPRTLQFNWPLHQNQQLSLGEDEAAASLSGFLQRQIDEHGCEEVFCMGEAAAERLRSLSLPCARRDLPATRAMLGDPAQKMALWRELRS